VLNDNKNMAKVQNPSGVISKSTLKFSSVSGSRKSRQRSFIASEPILIIPSLDDCRWGRRELPASVNANGFP